MKLTALRISRFGVWRELALNELSPGLNVFFGRNEAGKTTLLDFTRGMLFGFSPERVQRYDRQTPSDAPWGGAAHGIDGTRAWRLERGIDGARAVPLRADGSDDAAATERWENILGSVDAATFESVFAVGLREMQELGTLNDSQAGAWLYELSCGAAGRSVARALADVRKTRLALWSAPADGSQIPQLRAQRQRLRRALAQSRNEIAHHDKRGRTLAALDERIAGLEREVASWRSEARRWEVAHGLREAWAALAALPHQEATPLGVSTEALLRFEELSRRGRKLRRALHIATQRAERHRAGRVAVPVARSEETLRRAGLLLEQRETLLWSERQLAALREEARALRAEKAPPAPQPIAAPKPALAPEHARRVRIAGRRLSEARMADESARREAIAARRQHATESDELQRHLQGRSSADVVKAIEHAGQNVNHAKRRLQLDERLTRMERQRGELEEQTRELLDRQVLGYWTLGWLGGLFIFGVVLILCGLFLPRSLTGVAGWWLAGLGIGGIGVAVAARHLMEQSAENQLDACRAQINLLNRQLDQSRRERDALDENLPTDGGPLTRRVDQAEQELVRYENLLPLEGRVRAADQTAGSAEQKAEQARRDLESATTAWREALRLSGLSPELAPADARALLRTVETPPPPLPAVPAVPERLPRLEAEVALHEREHEHTTARLAQALNEWGIAVPSPTLAGRLDQLSAARREWLEAQAGRRRWLKTARQLRGRRKMLRARLARMASQRRRLLLGAGVSSPAEFRELVARWSEAARLSSTREQLRRQLHIGCAGVATPESIEQLLTEHVAPEIERRMLELRERHERGQRELSDLRAEQARLLDAGHGASDHEATRLELSMVSQRLHDALHRWRIAGLTEAAMSAQLKRIEQEHQPLTLRQASAYLERLTEGRYVRVWTPVEASELRIDAADGGTLSVAALSRGTREQLFLALRMAIVDDYARRGIELPLVLDDVLVNFDDQRARRAAEVLADYAAGGRQLFVLTCHEHIARAFQSVGTIVRDLGAGGAPWGEPQVVRQELPPPLPEVAPTPIEPERPREPKPVVTHRRVRRAVLHRRASLAGSLAWSPAPVASQEVAPPAPQVVFRRRIPSLWRPWIEPNSAEDFLGEFDERVFA